MHNFSRSQKVFIQFNSLLYGVDVYPDLSWSRVFQTRSYQEKTLHNPENLMNAAFINQASISNFSFTCPIGLTNVITPILFQLAMPISGNRLPLFNIFIQLDNDLYRISNCIITSQVLNLARDQILTMSIQGQGTILERISTALPTINHAIVRQYSPIVGTEVVLNSTVITDIAAISLESANEITWLGHKTIHNADQVLAPSEYVLVSRRISGSFTEFLTNPNKGLRADYSSNATLDIRIFANQNKRVETILPSIEYTRRISTDPLVTRVYDFSANSNPVNFNRITYS